MKKVIGTHNGIFHSDEIIAIALLNKVFEETSIIRSRDPKELQEANILVDVGGKFDGVKFFDHHQFKDGDKNWGLSSAGLVAKNVTTTYQCNECGDYGESPIYHANCSNCGTEAIIGDGFLLHEQKMLVRAVDARDTRVKYDPSNKFEPLFNAVNECNNIDIASKEQDIMFSKLVFTFTLYFQNIISYNELLNTVEGIGARNKAKKSKIMAERFSRVVKVGMNGNIPVYQNDKLEYVDTQLFGDKPFVFLSYDSLQDNYSITTNTKYSKILDVSKKVFVHPNGFFAKTKSLNDLKITLEEV